jgi:HAD superfamily phosphoserine phosphatase-like hydrolase
MKTKNQKPVAAFDVDGTLFRSHLLMLLTDECVDLQIFRRVVDVLFAKVCVDHRDRKITFEQYDRQLIELFTQRIRGKLRSDVNVAAAQVFDKHRDWLYVFTKTALAHLKKTHDCIIVTGAMNEVVGPLADYWGFEKYYATELEVDDLGRYTGRDKAMPVFEKGQAVRGRVAAGGATLKGSFAIGNGGSDIKMLETVDIPVAFNPNNVLITEAERRGWPVVVEKCDIIYVIAGAAHKLFRIDDADTAVDYVLNLPRTKKT